MSKVDFYKHLNADDGGPIGVEQYTHWICGQNYGAHRLLSALVNELRARDEEVIQHYAETRPEVVKHHVPSPLAKSIEDALNRGEFY